MASPITSVSRNNNQQQTALPITQVQRNEDHPDFNSPRQTSKATSPRRKKRGVFARIFCCGSSDADSSGTEEDGDVMQAAPHVTGEQALLPPMVKQDEGRVCLILDLDETLVHSSFRPVGNADFVIPVEIEDQVHQVYVLKRPGVDEFMKRCGELFEVVVFTASLSKYADPVLDLLDKSRVIRYRLFRESCSQHRGNYVKDLARLGRPLNKTIIVDNSPASYLFHPENALPIETWFDDMADQDLLEMIPVLEDLAKSDDVVKSLARLAAAGCKFFRANQG